MAKTTASRKLAEPKQAATRATARDKNSVVVPLSLRDAHKRVTRERIVSGAEDLFQKHGFRATSVEQIARAAGTTATTFYRHFKSKHDLIVVVQNKLTADVRTVVGRLNEMRRPTRALIRSWVDEYFAMWRRNHMLCDAYWEATTTDPELARGILPTTIKVTSALDGFLGRFPEKLRGRLGLRLALQTLLLDRVAYLAESTQSDKEATKLFDEFADILWVSLFEIRE